MNINLAIQEICNSPNFLKNFELIPVDHVLSFPSSVNYKIISPLVLKPGRMWFQIYVTDSIRVSITEEPSQQGIPYKVAIVARNPKITSGKTSTTSIMSGRRFILKAKTTNGDDLYFGTLKNPLMLVPSLSLSDYNGFTLTFSHITKTPFFFL